MQPPTTQSASQIKEYNQQVHNLTHKEKKYKTPADGPSNDVTGTDGSLAFYPPNFKSTSRRKGYEGSDSDPKSKRSF